MSKETEKMFRELHRYIEEHGADISSEEELRAVLNEFTRLHNAHELPVYDDDPDDLVEEYMELAMNAKTKKEQLKYINKALEVDPENLDVLSSKAVTVADDYDDFFREIQPVLEIGHRQMEEGGFFDDCAGDFWAVIETRPYMRVRIDYMHALIRLGQIKNAILEGEEMIRLCTNDNNGVRHILMHLYALMEDEVSAKKLFKKYGDYEDSLLLLPMSVLYYKLGDPDNAEKYLNRLAKHNKDTRRFIVAEQRNKLDQFDEETDPFGYQPRHVSELLMAYDEYDFLYDTVPYYFKWAERTLKSGSKNSSKGKKK